jgi:hypothetical protein
MRDRGVCSLTAGLFLQVYFLLAMMAIADKVPISRAYLEYQRFIGISPAPV